jgi:XTP/dITP diphosphohydrolase
MLKCQDNQLLIATRNPNKTRAFFTLLQPLGLQLYSALDLEMSEPEETGNTFEENALIKAKAYAQAANRPALADDSGVWIEALDGFPGVHTAPFAQEHGGYRQAATVLEEKLKGLSRRAEYCCCIVLLLPNGAYHAVEARIKGTVVFPPRGTLGWGFDFIFMPDGQERTYGEMPFEEKIHIDHRACALRKLLADCF